MPSQMVTEFDVPQSGCSELRIIRPLEEPFDIKQPRRTHYVFRRLNFFDWYQQPHDPRYFPEQLQSLRRQYVIMGDEQRMSELLREDPSLYPLLREAVKPLQDAFGENRILYLQAQASGEDSLLKVAVQLPSDFGDPERALLSFDTSW